MEIIGTILSGLALFGVGHYLGIKLGRRYEKDRAIDFMAEVTALLRKRLNLSEEEMIAHVKAIRNEAIKGFAVKQ